MDYEEKLEICCKQMAEDFGIKEMQAYKIITHLDLEDMIMEYYEDAIKEAEEEQEARWEREIEMNPDLYRDDIHGGV